MVLLLLILLACPAYSQIQVKPGGYKFSLPDDRGYSTPFAYVDLETQKYLRGVCIKPGGCYIDIYDLTKAELTKTIFLKDVTILNNFLLTKEKEIWALDNKARTLTLFDLEGNVKYKAHEGKGGDVGGPYTSYYSDMMFNPMLKHKNRLYWTTAFLSVSGKESNMKELANQGMIRQYDISRKTFSWVGQIPQSLKDFDFGYLNRFSAVKKNEMIIVAPFYSNEIMIYGLNSGNSVFPIVEKHDLLKQASPFAKLAGNPKSLKDSNGGVDHYASNSSYIGILHDIYRKVYYRVIHEPTEGFNKFKLKIIVLDEYFKVLSHHNIPDDYNSSGMFVTEKGLNILNHKKYKIDDTHLVFDSFTF